MVEAKLGANWLEKRGRGRDKYVMGRNGDTGPYSPENTKCITNAQNGYDRRLNGVAARGERSGGRKLNNKQVREIYLSSDKLKTLAQRYSVGLWTIFDIKKGKTWVHITEGLGPATRNNKGRPRTKPIKIRKKHKIGIPLEK